MLERLCLPPGDIRARSMSEAEIVYCYINILLDEQERMPDFETAVNTAFDQTEFLSTGGTAVDGETGA